MWHTHIIDDYLRKITNAEESNNPCLESEFSTLTFEEMKRKEFVEIKEGKVYITDAGKQQIEN